MLAPGVLLSVPASAHTSVEAVVAHVGERDAGNVAPVNLRLLNTGDMARTVSLPESVEAQLTTGNRKHSIWVIRDPATPVSLAVAPRTRYSLLAAAIAEGDIFAIPAWGDQRIALARHEHPGTNTVQLQISALR